MGEFPVRDRVFGIIATVMGVPPSSVTIDVSPRTIAQWDSLKHMNLILAVEEAFGVQFTDEDIVAIEDARSLLSVLETKGAA